jgi:osmotically-inducible protein OsmY
MGWDHGNEGFQNSAFQNSSRWQRSQFRPSEGDYGGAQHYSTGRNSGTGTWYGSDETVGGRGSYEGEGQGQFAGRGPRNYKRSDDRIEEDINEQLTRHAMVDATDIEVRVQNGEVTLRGTVDNRQAKRIVGDITDAVSGVKEVMNKLKVRQRGESSESPNKQEAENSGKERKAS